MTAAAYGHELRDPSHWPAEPASPAAVDPDRFSDAVAGVCGRSAARRLGQPTLDAASEASVDPFLLAALAFEQTGCDPRHWGHDGYGVLRLHPVMYFRPGNPPAPIARADLAPQRLLDAAHSLRVGALLLGMWQAQHEDVDARWRSARHRTAVSHFIWGDAVPSSAAEDRVLTARRRLLERYAGAPGLGPQPTKLGIEVISPLEGAPRLGTSGPGDERDGGARRHRGLDIAAAMGEPVHAIADGEVVFAGVDLPGTSTHELVSARASRRWSNREEVGPGGLFVCIEHAERVASCYFHLRSFRVERYQHVTAGDVIGEVGRSGVRASMPHLHFEVHVADRAVNPVPVLGALVIPPRETTAYRNNMARRRAAARARDTLSVASEPPPPSTPHQAAGRHGRVHRRRGAAGASS
jgi:hypothetical protein